MFGVYSIISVIKKLSQKLVIEYGRGYSTRNIFRMLKFYDYFPDIEDFQTLSAKFKKQSFRFRNKSKAYFYGNFLSTFKKYKVIPKIILEA